MPLPNDNIGHLPASLPTIHYNQETPFDFPQEQQSESDAKLLLHQELRESEVSPIPPLLEGCSVLNLGCKNGGNAYIFSAFVGEHGKIVAVDPSAEMTQSAEAFIDYHKELYGFNQSNTRFLNSSFDRLPIESESIDVIVFSSLLSPLSPSERLTLLKECHRVLREGGEIFFTDGFSNVRVPSSLQNDPILWQGSRCAGAIYTEDFRRLMDKAGFPDVRIVETAKISSAIPEIEMQMRKIGLSVRTIRAFKISSLEDRMEYYGQEAIYHGTVPDHEALFVLDSNQVFLTGQPTPICGNTAKMLSQSRYAPHFFVSKALEHQGLFQHSSF